MSFPEEFDFDQIREEAQDEIFNAERKLADQRAKARIDAYNLIHGRNVSAVEEQIYDKKKKIADTISKMLHQRLHTTQDDQIVQDHRDFVNRRENRQRLFVQHQPTIQQHQHEYVAADDNQHLPQPFDFAAANAPRQSRAMETMLAQNERDGDRRFEEARQDMMRRGIRIRSIFDPPSPTHQVIIDDKSSKRKRSEVYQDEDDPEIVYSDIPFSKEKTFVNKKAPKKTPTKSIDKTEIRKQLRDSQNVKEVYEFPEIMNNAIIEYKKSSKK